MPGCGIILGSLSPWCLLLECLGQIIWQRIYLHFFCLPANLLPSYLLLDACAVCTIALSLFELGLLASLSYLSLIFAFCPMSWPDHFALGFRFFLPLRFLHGISCRVPWPISLYYDRNRNPLPADAFASRFAILCLHICHPPTVCPQLPQRERKSMTFVIICAMGSTFLFGVYAGLIHFLCKRDVNYK